MREKNKPARKRIMTLRQNLSGLAQRPRIAALIEWGGSGFGFLFVDRTVGRSRTSLKIGFTTQRTNAFTEQRPIRSREKRFSRRFRKLRLNRWGWSLGRRRWEKIPWVGTGSGFLDLNLNAASMTPRQSSYIAPPRSLMVIGGLKRLQCPENDQGTYLGETSHECDTCISAKC